MTNKPEHGTTNAIRQVLMNELGLTRDSIRKEMQDIIRDVVDKHVSTLQLDQLLQRAINEAMQKEVKTGTWTTGVTERVKTEIEKQAAKYIKELVDSKLIIDINLKPNR